MADGAIDLENMRIRYDPKTGNFRLTSLDSRFKGKPFVLTVSRDSPTMRTLLEVFRDEGMLPADGGLPESVDLNSVGDWINGVNEHSLAKNPRPLLRDTRLQFPLGIASAGPVGIDLGLSAHTLISGQHREGNRRLIDVLRVFAQKNRRELRMLDDPDNPELSTLRNNPHYRSGRMILTELQGRLESLDRTGKMDYIEYENKLGAMPPVFIFAESIDQASGDLEWLSMVLEHGERAGFYLFATIDSVFDLPAIANDSLLLNFGRRIGFGPEAGIGSNIESEHLDRAGRATLRVEGSDPLLLQALQYSY